MKAEANEKEPKNEKVATVVTPLLDVDDVDVDVRDSPHWLTSIGQSFLSGAAYYYIHLKMHVVYHPSKYLASTSNAKI